MLDTWIFPKPKWQQSESIKDSSQPMPKLLPKHVEIEEYLGKDYFVLSMQAV